MFFLSLFFVFFNDTATTDIYTVLTHSFPTRRSSDLDHRLAQIVVVGQDDMLFALREVNGDIIAIAGARRSEEHTSELQSLMRISYAVFCLKKKKMKNQHQNQNQKDRLKDS